MSAASFTKIFLDEFEKRAAIEPNIGPLWHQGGASWTRLILGPTENRSAVLEKTLERWSGDRSTSLHHGWYTIDLMAVEPRYRDIDYWNTRPIALVEHENAKDVETEAWKLAHWRAPLKVLVFYRFESDDWLDNKVAALKQIIDGAQAGHAEIGAEYLLIAGCRIEGKVTWRVWLRDGAWTSTEHPMNVVVG